MRVITEIERLFFEGTSIGILADSGVKFNINDGHISEIGVED